MLIELERLFAEELHHHTTTAQLIGMTRGNLLLCVWGCAALVVVLCG